MSAHTQGPWRVETQDISVSTDDGEQIAQTAAVPGFGMSVHWNIPQRKANAHLIAAAPDLYEALAGLMYEIADCSQFDLWDNAEKAEAALAKARGEGAES